MTLINKWSVYIAHKVYIWQLGNKVLYECVSSDSPMSNKNLVITLVVDISYILKYDITIKIQIKYAIKDACKA